jgi:hypothetical protein
MVEFFGPHLVFDEILDRHGESAGRRIELNPADHRVESNVGANAAFFDPAHDVVVQYGPRRVRGNGAAEMLLKTIVRELEAFLGAVGP